MSVNECLQLRGRVQGQWKNSRAGCCSLQQSDALFRITSHYDETWISWGSYEACHFHRYYFVVEEDNTPLSVTVTPCDAPLEWKLTLQELPEEASAEGSGIIDIRQQWKRLMTRCVEISLSPTHN